MSCQALLTWHDSCCRYTYERSAIEKWLREHGASPITQKPLPSHSELVPNHTMRSAIHLLIPQHAQPQVLQH